MLYILTYRNLIDNNEEFKNELKDFRIYTLNSVNILRKYIGVFELFLSIFNSF